MRKKKAEGWMMEVDEICRAWGKFAATQERENQVQTIYKTVVFALHSRALRG